MTQHMRNPRAGQATGAHENVRPGRRNTPHSTGGTAPTHDRAGAQRRWLAARGFHLFPLIPGTKRPGVRDWENAATTDPDRLGDTWPTGVGVGIACGPSRLVVIDLDAHGGERPEPWDWPGIRDGLDVFAAVWAEHDLTTSFLDTLTVSTPSGGMHLYYRAPESTEVRNSAGRIGWQVDVRAAGGYVVAPGTVIDTDDGSAAYGLTHAPSSLPGLPGWLVGILAPPAPVQARQRPRTVALPSRSGNRVDALARTVAEAPEGQRNHVLNWAAYQLAQDGILTREHAQSLLEGARAAGLPDTEAVATIRSAGKGMAA